MEPDLPLNEWPEDERAEFNVHKNIAGWALIVFCASRLFARLPAWGVSPRLAAVTEGVILFVVVITAMWAVVARSKRRRYLVPWMTKNQHAFFAGFVGTGIYLLVLFFEAVFA